MALNWPVPRLRIALRENSPSHHVPPNRIPPDSLPFPHQSWGAVPTCYSVGQQKNRRNDRETDFLTGLRVRQSQLKVKGGT